MNNDYKTKYSIVHLKSMRIVTVRELYEIPFICMHAQLGSGLEKYFHIIYFNN